MGSRRYKGRYRVDTWRHPNWDYSGSGVYFITICTKNRNDYFGEIITTKEPNKRLMTHSHLGKIAYKYWQDIPEHFPSAKIDVFIIMPDHIHGILIINNTIVEAQNFAPLQSQNLNADFNNPNKFGPQSRNLASIIRGYKAGVKTYAVDKHLDFAWQKRFYDRIIRNSNK